MLPLENLSNEDYDDIEKLFQYLVEQLKTTTFKPSEYLDFKHALTVAYSAHKGQKRETTGEAYINHPIAVALIASNEIGLGATSVICALLHDVVEDNPNFKLEYIEEKFNKNVSEIVNGLTKIKSESKDKAINEQAATFAKLLSSIPQDIRIILIKLSDKIHNMRTMEGLSDNKLVNKAAETLHIYSPLAHKLGLYLLKNELEDLSFKYLQRLEYDILNEKLQHLELINKDKFETMQNQIRAIVSELNVEFSLDVTRKSLFAIFKKMDTKKIDLSSMHNYRSIQVVLNADNHEDERLLCYKAYLHLTNYSKLFQFDYSSLKDYIIIPRSNGFQALIFNLMGTGHDDWTEIQILTQRMKDIGDRGYPSEKFSGSNKINSERQKWISDITIQLQNPDSDILDFLKDFSADLTAGEISVISPKNEIIKLPKGATILDYAFAIHRDLGLQCDGAIVNKMRVGRDYVLQRSDRVEVLVSPDVVPHQSWFNIMITGKAKGMLRYYFDRQKRVKIEEGEKKVEKTLEEFGLESSPELHKFLVAELDAPDLPELYYNIGSQTITSETLYQKLKEYINPTTNKFNFFNLFGSKKKKTYQAYTVTNFNPKAPYHIEENTDHSNLVYAQCCNPIPGEDAIAYKNSDGIVFIHSRKCNSTIFHGANEKKNVALVEWGAFTNMPFKVKVMLSGTDRSGLLADISHVIYEQAGMNMISVNITAINETFKGEIGLEVHNKTELDAVIEKMKKIQGMNAVRRIY